MPHVDDGILHAYLDGALDALGAAGELPDQMSAAHVRAHLTDCADCRARLDIEREIRERAGVVLRQTGYVDAVIPALAALDGAPRARRRTWMPMTWAASMILALGAGWWGSVLWRAQIGADMAVMESAASPRASDSASRPASSPASPPASPLASSRAPMPPADLATVLDSIPRTGQVEVATIDEPAIDAVLSEMAPSPALIAPVARADDRAAGLLEGPHSASTLKMQTSDTALSASTADLAVGVPALVQSFAPIAGAQSPLRLFMPQSPPGPTATPNQSGDEDVLRFESILTREASGVMPFVATSDSDLDRSRNQVYIIADARLDEVEVANEVGQTTVRVRQTLASGESVEIVTWEQARVMIEALVVAGAPSAQRSADAAAATRGSAAPSAVTRDSAVARAARLRHENGAESEIDAMTSYSPRVLADGRHEIVLRVAESPVWIAVRAHVSAGDLRSLAARLVPLESEPDLN